jgi:outer membrane immunogenic protein
MKAFLLGSAALAALTVAAHAADLPRKAYTKAPPAQAVSSWTGFYLSAGGGYGQWEADQQTSYYNWFTGPALHHPVRMGGRGYFGTVGGGYDWQLNSAWVAGVFADVQFGNIKGTVDYLNVQFVGTTSNKLSYAVGARVGYLIAPNVLSYVNGGYSHADFSQGTLLPNDGTSPTFMTPKRSIGGWFVGGGVENSLDFFGMTAPGWFMKTEYRVAEYSRKTFPVLGSDGLPMLTGDTVSFKPYVQTVSTSVVYRFNSDGAPARVASAPLYTKAPAAAPVNWSGFYLSGGGGFALWASDNQLTNADGNYFASQRIGGRGYFGIVGGGYDWQIQSSWVAGIFADAQFGDIKGTILGPSGYAAAGTNNNKLSYAAGVRVGYLIAPNVLSYVNGGYSHADFSKTDLLFAADGSPSGYAIPKLSFDGWFLGGGVENSLDFFGISAPGWFMKTEYRVAEYGRKSANVLDNGGPSADGDVIAFKPYVQTVSTSLVYRFNWSAPVSARY